MTLSSALTRPRLPRRRERAGFRAALRKAGLGATAGSLHSLRDSFASLLIAKGLNVLFFSRRLRHAGPNVTLEDYVAS
jgi:integrase